MSELSQTHYLNNKLHKIMYEDILPYAGTSIFPLLARRQICAVKYFQFPHNEENHKQIIELIDYIETLIKQELFL